MVIKRIGVLSLAKMLGGLYGLIGFIAGIGVALALKISTAQAGIPFDPGSSWTQNLGFYAIIVLPVLYGAIGFVTGLLVAAVYNWLARHIGGIELELE